MAAGRRVRSGGAVRAWAMGLLLIVAVSEAALPPLIDRRIERAVASGFPLKDSVVARARAFPAVRMLLGQFDRLDLDIRGARLAGLRVDSIKVRSIGARAPLSDFAPSSVRWARALGDSEVTASISDADINDYLGGRDDALRTFSVAFADGLVRLDGAISFAGLNVSVRSQGHLVIEDGDRLAYAVDKLSVERSQLPGFLLDMLEGKIELGVDLSGLPFGISLEGMRVEAGVVHVYGRTGEGG